MAIQVSSPSLSKIGVTRKKMAGVQRRVMRAHPISWLTHFQDGHFSNAASRRYGYTPRSGERGSGRKWYRSYTHIKLLRQGHTRPLEYTGRGRQTLKTSRRAVGTRNRAAAILPARVFNLKNPISRIDMRRELTVVLDREQEIITTDAQRKLNAEIRRSFRG